MPRIQGGVKFTSYINKVLKDMDREEKGNRSKASKHMVDTIKDELASSAQLSEHRRTARKLGTGKIEGAPGMQSGTLYLNIDKHDGAKASYAGAVHPARHMHLLEFGTKKAPAYPVIVPTFEREAGKLQQILSQPIA